MADLLDPREYPLHEQIAEVAREIGMREHVYPEWVRRFKMSQHESDQRLGAMRAVKATLEQVQEDERPRSR